jgi:hypothetical protein
MATPKLVFAIIPACLCLCACAQSPEDIQPAYVSSIPYESWTCPQLVEEQQHLTEALATASAHQAQAHSNDIAGVVLLGLPVASMSGANMKPQIATMKGDQDAVRRASRKAGCQP